jgi:hypothetical protein
MDTALLGHRKAVKVLCQLKWVYGTALSLQLIMQAWCPLRGDSGI